MTTGPYPLTVNLYNNPANAGYALAFSVEPTHAVNGSLTYNTSSIPGQGVDATPIRATFHAEPNVQNGIQGAAEITVKGSWTLRVIVNGPAGHGVANVPITAVALPPIPVWFGWFIGFIPFYVVCVFFVMQMSDDKKREQTGTEHKSAPEMKGDTLPV